MTDLVRLVGLMDQCQRDTQIEFGSLAAQRLANWLKHEGDRRGLVNFVHERLIHAPQSGYALENRGKLSLERIVVYEMPKLFSSEDIEVAQFTLKGII